MLESGCVGGWSLSVSAPTTGGGCRGVEVGGYLFCQALAHCAELKRSQEQEID